MLLSSGFVGNQGVSRIYLGDNILYDSQPSGGITINLTFSGTPSSIEFADLKYNKQGVLSLGWDDGVPTSLDANDMFQTTTYDDGTGLDIPWRAGVAVIGRSSFNDIEYGNTPASGAIQYSDMLDLISAGWDIQNHGLYSNTGDNFGSDTPLDDISDLDALIMDRIGYQMNVTVVPSNEQGYVEGADTAGHIGATSQNDNVGGAIPPYPTAQWQAITDIATWPAGFKYLLRTFTDTWNQADFQDRIDDLINNSSASVHKLLRIGTHDSSPSGFADFVDYIQDNSDDRLWICSMRELLEYLIIRDNATISVNGNTVSVEVPAGLRWEDFTLIVEGATVTGASSPDADSITFGGNIINFYKDNS